MCPIAAPGLLCSARWRQAEAGGTRRPGRARLVQHHGQRDGAGQRGRAAHARGADRKAVRRRVHEQANKRAARAVGLALRRAHRSENGTLTEVACGLVHGFHAKLP